MVVGLAQGKADGSAWADLPWLHALVLSLLLQAMILFSNEASDAATDDATTRTLISGGAGVGAVGTLSPQALRRAAQGAGALGLLWTYFVGSIPLASLWLIAAILVWAYDGATFRLSRHPLGALCQAAGVGVVTPLLGLWLIAPGVWPTFESVVIGLCLGASGHILTALPDEETDRKVGKRTVVVALGAEFSRAAMLAGWAMAGLLLFGQTLCSAYLAVLLGLAWAVRRRPAAGGLTADLWISALIAVTLWITWIFK